MADFIFKALLFLIYFHITVVSAKYGPVCFDCEATINPNGCETRRACPADHVCLIYSFRVPMSDVIMFTQACHPKKHCLSENNNGDLTNIYSCCNNDLCNILNYTKNETQTTASLTNATIKVSKLTTIAKTSTKLSTTTSFSTTTISTTPTTAYYPCFKNWVIGPNSCYIFNNSHVPWNLARAICGSDGGDLVSINDISEDNFIMNHLVHVDSNFSSQLTFWVGGRYDFPADKWMWVDLSPVLFTRWSHNEPSSVNHGYDYIAVVDSKMRTDSPSDWEWVSMKNNTDLPFICEQSFRSVI